MVIANVAWDGNRSVPNDLAGERSGTSLQDQTHAGMSGARIQRPLISGSQVRALVRPPCSPPKLAVEDLPAERPIFGWFFAIGDGASPALCLLPTAMNARRCVRRRTGSTATSSL
jgi:hypothetical protein